MRKYIAPEDQELAICEMRISRVLEELDRTGEHCFYCGVMDSQRGIPERGCSIFIMIKRTRWC